MDNFIQNRDIKTPYFFFDKNVLEKDYQKLKSAIDKYWDNTKVAYSVKTNNHPPLLSFIKELGMDAEVVSEDEYKLLKSCAYDADRIVCNGPYKSKEWVDEILSNNIILNIDSKKEVEYILEFAQNNPKQEIGIGVRINIDIDKKFPGEGNGGEDGSKFGFSYESGELQQVIQMLQRLENIKIEGLHLHVNTKSRELKIYKYLVGEFLYVVKHFHLNAIKYFDIGGGFFGGIEHHLNWETYFNEISSSLKRGGYSPEKLQLIIEPGASLIAGAFSYVTKVIDYKVTSRAKFIVLDGSRIHIDPFLHKKSYFYKLYSDSYECNNGIKQIISGSTCLGFDKLFTIETNKPLSFGDMVIFEKVGSYTLSFNSSFIMTPPLVYSSSD